MFELAFDIVIAFFLLLIAVGIVCALIGYVGFAFGWSIQQYGKSEGVIRAVLGLSGLLGFACWLLHRWAAQQ